MHLTTAAAIQIATAHLLADGRGAYLNYRVTDEQLDTARALRDLAEAELSAADLPADERIPFPHLSQARFEERRDAMAFALAAHNEYCAHHRALADA